MIRIITSCLLFSQIICEDYSFSLSEILAMEESFQKSSEFVKKEGIDKPGILFIGIAKAGKSSILNYIIGTKLKAIRPSIAEGLKITQVNECDNSPEIGMDSTSFTTIPKPWKSQKIPNYIFWDCPGFDDNRGSIQDINNAMFIYQLIKSIDKLKFTLVVNAEDILAENINSFLQLLNHLKTLFGDNFKNVYRSISIIYTRVPFSLYGQYVDIEYISNILQEKVVLQIGLDMGKSSREFVNFTTTNKDNMAFLRKPRREGILSSCVYDNIISAILKANEINNYQLQDVKPSISSQSAKYLSNTYSDLKNMEMFLTLETLTTEFIDKYEKYSQTIIKKKNTSKIQELITSLTSHKKVIQSKSKSKDYVIENINCLRLLQDDFRMFIDSSQLIKKIKAISFIEIILKTEDKILFFIKNIMDNLQSEIERLIFKTTTKL